MLKRLFTALCLLVLSTALAHANEALIKKNLSARFPGAVVQSVTKTPVKGLYEVVIGDQLLYSNENGDYVLLGSLIDTKNRVNITQERSRKLFAVDYKGLPFDKAIKVVKGNGQRQMAVFSDPECPFCKRLEQELQKVDNVTVYTFLYPIESLHPTATKLARTIWCSKDRQQAWQDWMLKGTAPKADGNCDTPVEDIAKLGRQLHVSGTPTIVFPDGQVVPGAAPAAKLDKLLDAAQSEVKKK